MTTRRKFIKKLSTIGATVPFISDIKGEVPNNNGPIILCSRGEIWGEKVL